MSHAVFIQPMTQLPLQMPQIVNCGAIQTLKIGRQSAHGRPRVPDAPHAVGMAV